MTRPKTIAKPADGHLALSDLTFEEAELLEETVDMSITAIRDRFQTDKPITRLIRALKWLELRRSNPELTWDEMAGMSMMSAFAEADPKAKAVPSAEQSETGSTPPSASSTGT